MKRYDKLIFVSNSDTCRSPMAEALLKSKFLLDKLEIQSKGMVALFPEPVNPKAEAVMASHGMTISGHTSEQLEEDDFAERNLVLVMDEGIKERIMAQYLYVENLYLLSEYVGSTESIPSPLGKELPAYGECYETLESLITKLVVVLNEEELLC